MLVEMGLSYVTEHSDWHELNKGFQIIEIKLQEEIVF